MGSQQLLSQLETTGISSLTEARLQLLLCQLLTRLYSNLSPSLAKEKLQQDLLLGSFNLSSEGKSLMQNVMEEDMGKVNDEDIGKVSEEDKGKVREEDIGKLREDDIRDSYGE